jgi:hypothetical protein
MFPIPAVSGLRELTVPLPAEPSVLLKWVCDDPALPVLPPMLLDVADEPMLPALIVRK